MGGYYRLFVGFVHNTRGAVLLSGRNGRAGTADVRVQASKPRTTRPYPPADAVLYQSKISLPVMKITPSNWRMYSKIML